LKPGKYFLRFDIPQYYAASAPFKGSNPNTDCDITNLNGLNTTKTFTVMSGGAIVNIGAGCQIKATSGGDLKKDTNALSDNLIIGLEIDSMDLNQDSVGISKRNNILIDEGLVHQKLDLQWLRFDGEYNGNFIELNWATGIELNNDHFIVERKHESEWEFKEIGFVKADEDSALRRHEYEFDNFGINNTGTYYFRLKQVNRNGSFTYSQIIEIEVFKEQEVNVFLYPNPVRDVLGIELWLPSDSEVEALVIDKTGKVLLTNPFGKFLTAGRQDAVLRTTELAAGLYVLRIRTSSGIIHKQFTVVK
jgi:hypothetical protein